MKFKLSLFIVLISVFVGCKSTKEFYNKKGELRNITDAKLIKSVEDNYINYNTIFFKKFKAEVTFNGDSKAFKGNLFVLRDSSIIVSINPLMGIELLRVRLSPDKVEILDRTKKKYSVGDYGLLWDKFFVELDYYTIQSIILNEFYTYPISDINDRFIKRYKHSVDDYDTYSLQSLKSGRYSRKYQKDNVSGLVFHQFSILPEVFKISQSYIKDYSVNYEIVINYSNFLDINEYIMPTLIDIKGSKGSVEFSMKINFENIEINSEQSLGFNVSSKYDIINLNAK